MGPVPKPEMANRTAWAFRLAWAESPKLKLPRRPLELRDIANLRIITYPASPARFSSLTICSAASEQSLTVLIVSPLEPGLVELAPDIRGISS
jgi:hypothetical protein